MRISIFKYFTPHKFHTTRLANMDIKTFIFLDSETTGMPFEENNKTRMTELCFIAIQSEHISMGVYPRIQNKINFCFNPRKFINPEASKITGLTNDLLEYQTDFNSSCFDIIQTFLNVHRKPICLVAHNGNRFDYPILRAELCKTGNELSQDIYCVDSLLAFRALHNEHNVEREEIKTVVDKIPPCELNDGFDDVLNLAVNDIEMNHSGRKLTVEEIQKINETTPVKNKEIIQQDQVDYKLPSLVSTGVKRKKLFQPRPSFKLGNLYERLTSKIPRDAHQAECDVNMLIECAATIGQPFVDWCNTNAKPFCDIPMMLPGRKLGM